MVLDISYDLTGKGRYEKRPALLHVEKGTPIIGLIDAKFIGRIGYLAVYKKRYTDRDHIEIYVDTGVDDILYRISKATAEDIANNGELNAIAVWMAKHQLNEYMDFRAWLESKEAWRQSIGARNLWRRQIDGTYRRPRATKRRRRQTADNLTNPPRR